MLGTANWAHELQVSKVRKRNSGGRWLAHKIIVHFISIVTLASALPAAAQCIAPTNFSVSSSCSNDTITLSWSNQASYTMIDVSLQDSSGGPAIFLPIAGNSQSVTLPSLPPDRYVAQVRAHCAQGSAAAVQATVVHSPYSGGGNVDFIWAAEGAGAVDSVLALRKALTSNGLQPIIVDDLESYLCLGTPDPTTVLWVCLGTTSNSHLLTQSEAALLSSLHASGVSIYLEGSDVWSAPPTTFSAYDGVAAAVPAGDDSFTEMELIPFDCHLSLPSRVAYVQDDLVGNDSTDRLTPAAEQGGVASLLWRNYDDSVQGTESAYGTTVFIDHPNAGNVISSSWEFGGFSGDWPLKFLRL